ncbi:MAG TPA: Crp/Fnr family transcriptional regulator [Steroidobacteraceae bacterium]|nr:Crp/Fnr family transcriptional regulator [Steroidobacteraceae bacterium]
MPMRAQQLAGMRLFVGLSAEALADVAATGRVQSLPKGTILFTQGTAADRCHAVIAGRMRISQAGVEGSQLIVRFIGPGEMFGTMALFTDGRYPADAVSLIDSIEISWTEPVLLELIHRYPQIALNLVRIAGARLREAQERLRELATEQVDRRIAHMLLRLAGPGALQGNMDAAIAFPLTRQDIASMCGATLYTASRILKTWERAGYVSTHHRRLTIHQLVEIRRIAEGHRSQKTQP